MTPPATLVTASSALLHVKKLFQKNKKPAVMLFATGKGHASGFFL
jgi:hypothetical protein